MRPPTDEIRAFLYVRAAGVSQTNPNTQVERQLKDLREYARRRLYRIMYEAFDAGISGNSLSRPGLAVVMDGATSAPPAFDVLLVSERTALARDPALYGELISRLTEAGIKIEFVASRCFSVPEKVGGVGACNFSSVPGGHDDQD